MTTGETVGLVIQTFVSKVMALLFNAQSWFAKLFFQAAMFFNFMAVVTNWSDFGAQENKVSHCSHCFPVCLPWSDGLWWCHSLWSDDALVFVSWMLSFEPVFSLSCFTFIKRFFSFSSLGAVRIVLSAYLRLLVFKLTLKFKCYYFIGEAFSHLA